MSYFAEQTFLKKCSNGDVGILLIVNKFKKRQFIGRPFVKRFALCHRTVVCLSVTLVYCDQTVGRIKMKLGTDVGLGQGHIVLDGAQLPLLKRGTAPNFCPMSVAAKRLDGSRYHLARM